MSATLHKKFSDAVKAADAAGRQAVADTTPTPMVVGTPKNMMASLTGGDDGGFDQDQPIYYVPDGVCGFAWVNVKASATEGRKFLNWLKGSVKSSYPVSDALADAPVLEPRADSYYKGVSIWVTVGNQSMQKKEAYGQAFSKALNGAGIDGLSAYCMSRMD